MINEKIIILNSSASTREEALNELADMLLGEYISDKEEYINAVMAREEEMSTCVGNGIVIPHGKSRAVIQPFVAYLGANKEFIWDESEKLIQMVFLIGVPEVDEGVLHLKILSQLSRRLMRQEFLNQLLESKSSKEIYNHLKEVEDSVIESEREEQ